MRTLHKCMLAHTVNYTLYAATLAGCTALGGLGIVGAAFATFNVLYLRKKIITSFAERSDFLAAKQSYDEWYEAETLRVLWYD